MDGPRKDTGQSRQPREPSRSQLAQLDTRHSYADTPLIKQDSASRRPHNHRLHHRTPRPSDQSRNATSSQRYSQDGSQNQAQSTTRRRRRSRTREAIYSPFSFSHNTLRSAFVSSSLDDLIRNGSSRSAPKLSNDRHVQDAPPIPDEATLRATLTREQTLRGPREQELSSTWNTLLIRAQTATQRLDDMYYSLQEHNLSLHARAIALDKLRFTASETLDTFQRDAQVLGENTNASLSRTEQFSSREHMIGKLAQRLDDGKKRSVALEQRMQDISARLIKWEGNEVQRQTTRHNRLKGAGIAALCVVILVIITFSWRRVYEYIDALKYDPRPRLGIQIKVPETSERDRRVDARLHVLDEL